MFLKNASAPVWRTPSETVWWIVMVGGKNLRAAVVPTPRSFFWDTGDMSLDGLLEEMDKSIYDLMILPVRMCRGPTSAMDSCRKGCFQGLVDRSRSVMH